MRVRLTDLPAMDTEGNLETRCFWAQRGNPRGFGPRGPNQLNKIKRTADEMEREAERKICSRPSVTFKAEKQKRAGGLIPKLRSACNPRPP